MVKSAANAFIHVTSSCVTTDTGQILRSQSAYALIIWIDIAKLLSTEIVSILLPAIYERARFPPLYQIFFYLCQYDSQIVILQCNLILHFLTLNEV